MVAIQKILCPVDLSDISRRALEYAVLVARWYRATVHVLLVEPVVLSPVDFPPMAAVIGLTPEARAALTARLDRFVDSVPAPGVTIEKAVAEGFVIEEVLARARDLPADLLVMGTHGRGGFQQVVLGSITEKVLRKVCCPVLTVPPGADATPTVPGPFTSILCATDFSNASLSALEYAISLAQEAGSRLTVVHAMEWPSEDVAAELHSPAFVEYRERLEARLRRQLDALIPSSVREVCNAETVLAAGKPAVEIARLARDTVADLIVLGVHGRGVVDLTLFGSTTHRVIRQAPCPVMTVRSK